MITVNMNFINKCVLGISNEPTRYYLQGVSIKDVDGYRHYCGTNGHILIHCKEAIGADDGSLGDQELIVKIDKPIKTKLEHCDMIINDDFITFKLEKVASFNLIDATYPHYENVIPVNPSTPTEFAFFDWKYLKIVDDVLGKPDNSKRAILMDNAIAPAMFTNANIEGVEVVVMPMRV